MIVLEQIAIGIAIGITVLSVGGIGGFVLAMRGQVSQHEQWIKITDKTIERHESEISLQKEKCANHAHFFGEVSESLKYLKEGLDDLRGINRGE